MLGESREDSHVDFAVDQVLNVMLEADAGEQRFDVTVFRQLIALSNGSGVEQCRGHVIEHSAFVGLRFNPCVVVLWRF